ncbi:oligosaccharyl transferase, archaeosortase A system-associated [Methanoregula sp.]|uniref:oligosaccharyl transferase, archaeosortase A system-associated n=1 Tax=Methanoregula sp. TaxID=2052170 RepID=UPI00236BFEF9|nr:oligosaccharyl transferase, archaeosortase A system-associated [Methanoregula sp.]MDD1687697.1 oligosaccharyl transferase, archaeosortase A system-associated [Methanoregula sp.]
MDLLTNRKHQTLLIVSALLFFSALALVLRMIPALFIPNQGFLYSSGSDIWYTLRQVEVMVAHFPQYNWFDPMTAYPAGKTIDWGPLFPFLAVVLCTVFGASSRADIVNIAGWVAPLLAALMVPVTYHLGKQIRDWKAGLVAAGFVSVISYTYFYFSSYGWMDHNSAETFFVALFFLAYISALASARTTPVDREHAKSLYIPVLLSCLAAILYFLGYLTSPTVMLALLVIGIYMFIQYIVDYVASQQSEYLLLTNGVLFAGIAILVALFGFPADGLSLTTYSAGHLYVMLGLLAETVLLYGLARACRNNKMHYGLSLAGIVIGGAALLQFLPILQTIRDQAFSLVFGSSAFSVAVRETQPWSFTGAYETFNLALILMAGGLIILAWYAVKRRQGEHIFLLTWFVVMLLVTIPHQRFLLYLTVPVALLTAIGVTESLKWSWDAVEASLSPWLSCLSGNPAQDDGKRDTGKKDRKTKKSARASEGVRPGTALKGITFAGIIILALLVFAISAVQDYAYVANTPANEIPGDWTETLGWMENSTALPDVDYFGTYDRETFTYPNGSYGILAPWEEGHRITFFAKRLPITNPFQDHLSGTQGAAAFYLNENESAANAILTNLGGRYVATDLGTATDTFPSLIPWVTNTDEISPYLRWFFVEDPGSSGMTKTHLLGDDYFQSMIVRLQVFDGSFVLPDTAQYTRYTIRSIPDTGTTAGVGGLARVITGTQTVNVSQETIAVSPEGATLSAGATYADLYSSVPYQPVKKVPALTHYRLVHESPTNISMQLYGTAQGSALPDIRLVKVFEYVNGAHIPGEGTIELTLVTNTGRNFVYRQESTGGEFVVPYATEGSTSDVRATGPYHIVGTTKYITVTEANVLNGNKVVG